MRNSTLYDRLGFLFLAISVLLIAAAGVWSYSALHTVAGPLIVHFNNLEGINQIGSMGDFLEMAILSLVVVIINSFLFLEMRERSPQTGLIITSSTLLFTILIFIGFWVIIGVNR